jgi:hypothetical protein
MNNEGITVPLYYAPDINNINTTDENVRIIRFVNLDDFTSEFQQIHAKTGIWGCYTDGINTVAIDNLGDRHDNILK